MKQLQFSYVNSTQLRVELEENQEIKEAKRFYFHLFSSLLNDELLIQAVHAIQSVYPDCTIIASSTAGNIVDSMVADEVMIIANLFEKESSRFEVLHYDFDQQEMEEITAKILQEVKKKPWVKAVEFFHTIPVRSTTFLCEQLSDMAPEIQVFGGIVCSTDLLNPESFLFSDIEGMTKHGLICVLYGGENLHIHSVKISGWKPIGHTFKVNKAEGNILKELDGIPAFDIYQKYLNIKNDGNFFLNALDFPIMYEHNNTTIIRASGSSNDDGSLNMSADIEEGSIVRLSYGEPRTILESVRDRSKLIKEFQPDVMHIFSCAARKTFWADSGAAYELGVLKGICSNSGFFSHGEFLREKNLLNQHNLTLVIASLREGEKKPFIGAEDTEELNPEFISSRLPLAARMATFIRETSYELEKTNNDLALANLQLKEIVKKDTLTGLDNRFALNDLMASIESGKLGKGQWTMYGFDVNGLKTINDTYGHLVGDEQIKTAANIIRSVFQDVGYCFRIGGDEFVALVDIPIDETSGFDRQLEHALREQNQNAVYPLSIAKGKSSILDERGHMKSISKWRMDTDLSMYRNKSMIHKAENLKKDKNLQQLIALLISVEEAKDPYTAFHSDRVCSLSELLARKMGLTERSIDLISDAAKLHDIGKVGISDAILFKPGRLTDEEFAQIKAHPIIGAKILRQSNYMSDVVDIVLHHHERYDGLGYPHGLSGTEIPLGARIIALADSIDAMSSKRVYRNALPLSVCYEEILQNIGKMYDPAIANIALENWSEIVKIIMTEDGADSH